MSARRFDFSSTAEEVSEGLDLSGRLALITGGASGLGSETARVLALRGARVVIAARDMAKADAAIAAILADLPTADLEAMQLDLADLDSVRAFAVLFAREHPRLDLLIANAGVMASPPGKTADGFDLQFGTNHLGHFVLVNRLHGPLKAAADAGRKPRVVVLSSRAHRRADVDLDDPNFEARPYDKWQAYGESKTANALFALELDRRWRADGIRAFSVHPGGIVTELGRHLTDEDRAALLERFQKAGAAPQFKSVPQGAATTVFAATAPELDGEGGYYLENAARAARNDDMESDRPEQQGAGVAGYAQDPDRAARLWALSEGLVRESFS